MITGGSTEYLFLERGIRQEDPFSAYVSRPLKSFRFKLEKVLINLEKSEVCWMGEAKGEEDKLYLDQPMQ